jgi:hypothetical protein
MPIFAAFFAVAPEMLAVEAAAVTAAEIAAAEAAAAAAAEAAAVAAAEQAAAATAAEAAVTQAGLTAAEQAAQAGIMEVGGATANAASAPITTAEAVQTAAQQAGQNLAPETLTRGIQGVPEVANAGLQNVPYQFSPAELEALQSGQEIARLSSAAPPTEVTAGLNTKGTMFEGSFLDRFNNPSSITDEVLRSGYGSAAPAPVAPPVTPVAPPANPGVVTSPVSGFEPTPGFEGFTSGPQGADPNFFKSTVAPGPEPMTPLEYRLNAPPDTMQSLRLGTNTSGMTVPNTQPITSVSQTPMAQPQSSLMKGLDSAMDWAKNNKFQAASAAYMGANLLGLNKPSGGGGSEEEYDGPLSRYKLSPDFKGSYANPEDFRPTRSYAMGGGIMGTDPYSIPVGYDEGGNVPEYAKGGSLSDSIEQYQKMLDGKPRAALPASRDVGIYYDQDPDTRYQDALTAAQIRQAKVNKRANVDLPGMKRPAPMGQLNLRPPGVAAGAGGSSLDPESAASGGIMHSSLGGYAAGGNPRLLRGPGDGMSDNIPATISGRQPARLADGEFVIPADVVSHLGNGSTEAGAKQLHAMMDKVRRARTGNPKQGKNIKPQKYMPK